MASPGDAKPVETSTTETRPAPAPEDRTHARGIGADCAESGSGGPKTEDQGMRAWEQVANIERTGWSELVGTKGELPSFRAKLSSDTSPCDDVCVTPETRASFAQHVQEIVLSLPSEQITGIQHRMGSVWDEIANAPKVAWLGAKTYDTLSDSVRAQLGDAGTVELYRKVGRKLLANPHFQSFVETALKIFGVSPHAVLKIVPRGRSSVVKHSGTLVYEKVDARCARLRLTDFPPSTFSKGATVLLLSGAFLGVLDATNAGEGAKVETTDVDFQRGCATFILSW